MGICSKENENKTNNSNQQNNQKNIIEENDNSPNKKKLITPREIIRFDAQFDQPVEEMSKEKAYYQFLSINSYYDKYKNQIFPEGYFNWKDPNLASKLESEIKNYNDNAEVMSGFVQTKVRTNNHPETMDMYVEIVKHEDYIWQLLNRQLSIYKKFYDVMDDQTIQYIEKKKKEDELNGL